MPLELDHLFICVDRDAPEAASLARFGLHEGRRRRHIGQGTANICFFFDNAMLELLWVCDSEEAQSALVRPTHLWERSQWRETGFCPFGICCRPTGPASAPLPFQTWEYKPPYVPSRMSIRMAANSERGSEPLVFMWQIGKQPGIPPQDNRPPLNHSFDCREISAVRITLPRLEDLSPELCKLEEEGLITLFSGTNYLMEIGFDREQAGQTADFTPELPLRFRW